MKREREVFGARRADHSQAIATAGNEIDEFAQRAAVRERAASHKMREVSAERGSPRKNGLARNAQGLFEKPFCTFGKGPLASADVANGGASTRSREAQRARAARTKATAKASDDAKRATSAL